MKFVEIRKENSALWLTLNRPEVKNALSIEMAEELLAAVKEGMKDKSVAVIVLSARGDSFSAGGDIKKMNETKNIKSFFLKISRVVNSLVLEITWGPKPVVAAIPGYVGGISLGLILATDLRIASKEAKFNAATTRLGLVANGGATWFLPKIVGLARASEILLLGEVLSAEEALKIGLVNRVVSPEELERTTQEIAERLSDGPKQALARLKKILNQGLTSSLPVQLERERQAIAWSATTGDFREGMTSFLQKRKPVFNRS